MYRMLKEWEIIKNTDEILQDGENPKWIKVTRCVGKPAPNPLYISHRIYRRKITKEND